MINLRLDPGPGGDVSQYQPLIIPTRELQARFAAMYDNGRVPELIDPYTMLAGLAGDFPTPPHAPWPKAQLGAVYWPVVGLSNYAFATLLVDELTLGRIRAWIAASTVNRNIWIQFRDEPETDAYDPEVEDSEYDDVPLIEELPFRFLAARPLVRTTTDALATEDDGDPVDAWVLLLVDDRYPALHNHGFVSGAGASPGAWNDILVPMSEATSFIGGHLGVPGVDDAVDADYLTPDPDRWVSERTAGRSATWLRDIAAMMVGSRYVCQPDYGYLVQRPTAANADVLSDAHDAAVADGRLIGGGPITAEDVECGRPSHIGVAFRAPGEATSVLVESADFNQPVMYGGGLALNTIGTLCHWCDAAAATDAGDRTALADQFATDWDAWQHDQYDTLYAGFIEVPASGFLWAVTYYHDAHTAYTRFHRAPHWWGYLLAPRYEGSLAGGTVTTISGGTTGLTFTDPTTTPVLTGTLNMANGGLGVVLADPGVTGAVIAWDDAAGQNAFFTPDTSIGFSGGSFGVVEVEGGTW